jgi:hypothetical protein
MAMRRSTRSGTDDGVEITTIDPRVLLHTFGTIGGIIRRKDVPKITALAAALESGAAVSRFSEADCAAFARYTEERDLRYPRYRAFLRLVDRCWRRCPRRRPAAPGTG